MMKLTIEREYRNELTEGVLLGVNREVLGSTLELKWNNNKPNESCIPEGEYLVQRDKHGRHKWFKLLGVPDRSFIEIHEGYNTSHSQGCILLDLLELQDLMLYTKGNDFTLEITSYDAA